MRCLDNMKLQPCGLDWTGLALASGTLRSTRTKTFLPFKSTLSANPWIFSLAKAKGDAWKQRRDARFVDVARDDEWATNVRRKVAAATEENMSIVGSI